MPYLIDYYIHPFIKALSRWKLLIFSIFVESIFLAISYKLGLMALQAIYKLMENPTKPTDDTYIFIKNVSIYNAELSAFIWTIFLSLILFLIAFLLLYSLTRTLIWNKIMHLKDNYLRNLLIDAVLYIIFLAVTSFIIKFIKQDYYLFFVFVLIFPLLYLSFHCHLNYKQKKIFSSAFSIKLIYLLPHTLILFALSVLMIRITVLAIIFFIILNFFRIYAYEIIK